METELQLQILLDLRSNILEGSNGQHRQRKMGKCNGEEGGIPSYK